jgi:NAD(P)-dependent dehydrogenase (short-subunit alcohol dehydrogenase family)
MVRESEYSPEMLAEANRKIPLGRHAKPEEVASLFPFLASEEAA